VLRIVWFVLLPVVACSSPSPTRRAEASGPDSLAAIRIAETEWRRLFGDVIDDERPFSAQLVDTVWIVGTSWPPPGALGGGAFARISARDGSVIEVGHTQ